MDIMELEVMKLERLSARAAEEAVNEATVWFIGEVGLPPGKDMSMSAATCVQAFVEGMLTLQMAMSDDADKRQFLHDIKRKAGNIIHGKNFYNGDGQHLPENPA